MVGGGGGLGEMAADERGRVNDSVHGSSENGRFSAPLK